jgi:two-component system, LytTR family, sensor histidine kinase AlgZ
MPASASLVNSILSTPLRRMMTSLPDTAPAPLHGADGASLWPASTRPVSFDAAAGAGAASGAAFDVCRGALALRALLAVNGAVVLAVLAGADSPAQALATLGPAIAAALIGTLAWLVLVCALRAALVRLAPALRSAALMALGAVLAPLACAPMFWLQLIDPQPLRLVALVLIGAALALALALWLQWREGRRTPADARARLAELQSRIRPHFLFNTLNTAVSLVRVDPARAEGLLEDLAELFRAALADDSGGSSGSVTLASELELARRYLAIEQLRFGDRLRLEWQLDAQTDAARLPPLVLQPLLENAVRHGIEPAEAGGTVRVRTRVRLGRAEITIDNSVSGSASRPGHGLALENVRERLRLLHDLDAQFEVQQAEGRYRVRIVVPLVSES